MTKTILVVDDKPNMRAMVRDYLTEENFHVLEAENGQQALAVTRQEKPDLILLDIMMPKMDGYEFLQAFRKEQSTPIILLTARLEETDKVLGLELGADDYVTKPFGLRELEARIRAVLRRAEGAGSAGAAPTAGHDFSAEEVLQIGEVYLNKGSHEVRVGDRLVDLTPSEFDLLAILMGAPGRVFSRIDLLEKLQGTTFEGVVRTIDYHIRNLRTKIEVDPSQPRYIETVFGVGYRFHRYQ
jgi:DNA-binding response OmpR family regulator